MTELSPDEIRRLHAALEAMGSGGVADRSGGDHGIGERLFDDRALVAAATTAVQLGRFDDALALARAALVSDPESARAWSLAGRALLGKGEDAEARRALETSISLDDKDLATALLAAESQVKTGAPSAARALLTYVILHEQGAPELRAKAQTLLDQLDQNDQNDQNDPNDPNDPGAAPR